MTLLFRERPLSSLTIIWKTGIICIIGLLARRKRQESQEKGEKIKEKIHEGTTCGCVRQSRRRYSEKAISEGHEVIAADMAERDLGIEKKYEFKKIDVTDPATLKGICDGCEAVITTVGLTKGSAVSEKLVLQSMA